MATTGLEVSHTRGLAMSGGIGSWSEELRQGVASVRSGSRKWADDGLKCGGPVRWRVTPTVWTMSRPKRGTGHEVIIKREWEKWCPSRTQAKGWV